MTDHISRSFEEDLSRLKDLVIKMGGLTIEQLDRAVHAADRSDVSMAALVIEREPEADRLEHEIDNQVIRVLALRQPMAVDLRHALSALRIANELERICDHAKDFAQRLIAFAAVGNARLRCLINLGRFATVMVKDAVHAYQEADDRQAQDVWRRDKELDEMYTGSLPRIAYLHGRRCAADLCERSDAVHGARHRARWRSRDEHRGNGPLSGRRAAG